MEEDDLKLFFQGNENNFRTARECFQTCHPEEEDFQLADDYYGGSSSLYNDDDDDDDDDISDKLPILLPFSSEPEGTPDKICSMSADPGPCHPQDPAHFFNRFYFNSSTSTCQVFFYGGCGGNHNNFQRRADCLAFCGDSGKRGEDKEEEFHPSDCVKSPKHGSCHLRQLRWFFSHWDNICKPYNYSGCGANRNTFLTEAECQSKCPELEFSGESRCELQRRRGDCRVKRERGETLLTRTRSNVLIVGTSMTSLTTSASGLAPVRISETPKITSRLARSAPKLA